MEETTVGVEKKIYVNIGCFDKKLPGFINVDVREDVKPDRVDNHLLETFEENSVDLIYASHIFEHLKEGEAISTLYRWYKVLKKGGRLYLSVPDFDAVVKRYIYTENLDELQCLLHGSQRHPYDFHYRSYNFKTIQELMSEASFYQIEKYDWWTTPWSYCDDFSQAYLPAEDRDIKLSHGRVKYGKGLLMSLNVRGTK